MERRRLLIGVLVLALLGVGGWMYLRQRNMGKGTVDVDGVPVATGAGGPATSGGGSTRRTIAAPLEVPAFLSQPGAPDRKIAGRVVQGGQPVAGAEVRLRANMVSTDAASDKVVTTGADGRFDFGSRAPTMYILSASAPKLAPAVTWINLADPTAHPPSDQLELELQPCQGSVFGQVRDASGGPIAGALLRIGAMTGTETGPDGAYELCLGQFPQLRIDASGYGSLLLFVGGTKGRVKRDIILIPEGTIEGKVVRAAGGEPVARASLTAFPFEFGRERPAPAIALADEQGEFRLSGLQSGRYRVWARGPGLGSPDSLQVVVVAGETSGGHVIKLTEQVSVSGVVKRNGKPVAGAAVGLIGKTVQTYSMQAISQDDGSFVITSAFPGAASVQVRAFKVRSPLELDVPAVGLTNVVIDVAAMLTIRGRVLREGKPVANATLQAPNNVMATSKKDGSYELEGLAAGESQIYAQSEEAGAFTQLTVQIGEGEVKEGVDIELESGATISGQIVDEGGAPLAGVRVVWTHVKSGDVGIGTTDADGAYVADSMTGKGDYKAQVFATAEAGAPLPPADAAHPVIKLADGNAHAEGVRLRVKNERRTIQGRVIDGTGAAIADARVVALSVKPGAEPVFYSWAALPSARSDVEGDFAIAELGPGTYALRAYAPGGSDGTVRDVMAGATGVFVTVQRAGGLRGKLVGYSTPAVPVYVAQTDGSNKFFPAQVEGDTFRADGLAPGKYVVSAQTLHEGDAKLVEIRGGAPTEVVMQSQGSGTVEGVVTEQGTNAPLAGFGCHTVLRTAGGYLSITNWDPANSPHTDAQGRFVNPSAPAGDIHVTCFGNGPISSAQATATLAKGGKATVRMKAVRRVEAGAGLTVGVAVDVQQAEPRISRVEPGSAAAKADVRAGDLVVSVDGASLEGLGADGVRTLILNHASGTNLVLGLLRGSQTLSVTLPVVDRE